MKSNINQWNPIQAHFNDANQAMGLASESLSRAGDIFGKLRQSRLDEQARTREHDEKERQFNLTHNLDLQKQANQVKDTNSLIAHREAAIAEQAIKQELHEQAVKDANLSRDFYKDLGETFIKNVTDNNEYQAEINRTRYEMLSSYGVDRYEDLNPDQKAEFDKEHGLEGIARVRRTSLTPHELWFDSYLETIKRGEGRYDHFGGKTFGDEFYRMALGDETRANAIFLGQQGSGGRSGTGGSGNSQGTTNNEENYGKAAELIAKHITSSSSRQPALNLLRTVRRVLPDLDPITAARIINSYYEGTTDWRNKSVFIDALDAFTNPESSYRNNNQLYLTLMSLVSSKSPTRNIQTSLVNTTHEVTLDDSSNTNNSLLNIQDPKARLLRNIENNPASLPQQIDHAVRNNIEFSEEDITKFAIIRSEIKAIAEDIKVGNNPEFQNLVKEEINFIKDMIKSVNERMFKELIEQVNREAKERREREWNEIQAQQRSNILNSILNPPSNTESPISINEIFGNVSVTNPIRNDLVMKPGYFFDR